VHAHHRKLDMSPTCITFNCIVGCAMYVDILKSPSLPNMVLQGNKLDVVLGIKNTSKSLTELKNLEKKDPFKWLSVK